MTAKTPAERQAAYRARKAATPEVRGIFARPEDHSIIKAFAAGVNGRPSSAQKATSVAEKTTA